MEADADHRVPGLEVRRAAILRGRRSDPRIDRVVHEWIVTPLGDLVAEAVDVRDEVAERRVVRAGPRVGGVDEGLDVRVAVAAGRARPKAGGLVRAVIAEHAADVDV